MKIMICLRETYSLAISDDKIGQYVIGRILIEGLGSSEQDKKKDLSFLKLSAKQDYLKAILFLADNFCKWNSWTKPSAISKIWSKLKS